MLLVSAQAALLLILCLKIHLQRGRHMLTPWCEGVFAFFLLYTSKFWSEELNYSRSPTSFWFAIVSVSSLSLNGTPGAEISQVLMRFVTWWWRLLVSVAFCLRHAFFFFFPFWEAESTAQRLHLAHYYSAVSAVAVISLFKSQGANRTVGHLDSYLAPFPISSQHG